MPVFLFGPFPVARFCRLRRLARAFIALALIALTVAVPSLALASSLLAYGSAAGGATPTSERPAEDEELPSEGELELEAEAELEAVDADCPAESPSVGRRSEEAPQRRNILASGTDAFTRLPTPPPRS